ncbi:hypothetical protein ACTL6U_04815 [Rhodovibrionaceae bacterium A322]
MSAHEAEGKKTIALLFRTHFTNAMVEEGFDWLRQRVPDNVDVFFTCDETHGSVKAPDGGLKFGHNVDDAERLGLYPFPQGKLLWYNIDYPFYFFYDQYPDYDLYLMVEYDVFFARGALERLIEHLEKTDDDFYSTYCGQCGPEWYWYPTGRTFYKEVYQSFFPVSALSNRAIWYLYKKRLEQTETFLQDSMKEEEWPFGEAFVPSELSAIGYSINHLENELGFAGAGFTFENLQCVDFMDRDDPDLSIHHPVMDQDGFVQKLIARTKDEKLESFLTRLPDVLATLRQFDPDDLHKLLRRYASKAQQKKVMALHGDSAGK